MIFGGMKMGVKPGDDRKEYSFRE